MNNSEVRKHLKKGELAVETLESLGWAFQSSVHGKPRWVAPVKTDAEESFETFKEALTKKLTLELELKHHTIGTDPRIAHLATMASKSSIPNIRPNIQPGDIFQIRQASIPSWSVLREYGSIHFAERRYRVIEVARPQTPQYPTGWAVLFEFPLSFHRKEVVWLPLSCCAFVR